MEIWFFPSLKFEFLFYFNATNMWQRSQVYIFLFLNNSCSKRFKCRKFQIFHDNYCESRTWGPKKSTTWTLLPVVWTLSATSQLHKICYLSIFLCTVYMCANNLKLLQATGPVELGARGARMGQGAKMGQGAMVCLIKIFFLNFVFLLLTLYPLQIFGRSTTPG